MLIMLIDIIVQFIQEHKLQKQARCKQQQLKEYFCIVLIQIQILDGLIHKWLIIQHVIILVQMVKCIKELCIINFGQAVTVQIILDGVPILNSIQKFIVLILQVLCSIIIGLVNNLTFLTQDGLITIILLINPIGEDILMEV